MQGAAPRAAAPHVQGRHSGTRQPPASPRPTPAPVVGTAIGRPPCASPSGVVREKPRPAHPSGPHAHRPSRRRDGYQPSGASSSDPRKPPANPHPASVPRRERSPDRSVRSSPAGCSRVRRISTRPPQTRHCAPVPQHWRGYPSPLDLCFPQRGRCRQAGGEGETPSRTRPPSRVGSDPLIAPCAAALLVAAALGESAPGLPKHVIASQCRNTGAAIRLPCFCSVGDADTASAPSFLFPLPLQTQKTGVARSGVTPVFCVCISGS